MENLKNKLSKITSKKPSKWLEEATWRDENEFWLEKTRATAIRILTILKNQGINQKILAERLNVTAQQVSKMLSGTENFTFKSVCEIEKVLGCSIFEVTSAAPRPKGFTVVRPMTFNTFDKNVLNTTDDFSFLDDSTITVCSNNPNAVTYFQNLN